MQPRLNISDDVLESFQTGVLGQARDGVDTQTGADRLGNEVSRLEAEIQERAEQMRQFRTEKTRLLTAKAETDRKVSEIVSVILAARSDRGLPAWSVCVHCQTGITRVGEAWGHDSVEGRPAECAGTYGTFASPVQLPAVPVPPSVEDGQVARAVAVS
ncbi:hypothetical protein [Actinacidiphila oryziradicis]|uniref:hypothetical protein n=1 Tax=Actinacidiphila oryziradicis TaxID=2571141 RepID=UPI0023F1D8C7|nr:hypothetical protein [Actinacidiphila oryziradicis]MCW2870259.1 hypothetical protein [Actinacidiphila oryziradicis]